jgi:hypothetical protein
MFGLFESSSEKDAITTHHYEGSVISSDYNLDCPRGLSVSFPVSSWRREDNLLFEWRGC